MTTRATSSQAAGTMNWRELKPGDRIRLIEMVDDPNPVPVGTEGTVTFVTDLKLGFYQIGVNWDNGNTLSMAEIDKWEKISG